MILSDQELLQQYIQGDEKSLEILVQRYLKIIYNLAYQYAKNTADAEDITQEIFIKLWRNVKKFDQSKPFKPWFFSLAKNCCMDYLKKKKNISFSALKQKTNDHNFIENFPDTALLPNEIFEQEEKKNMINIVLKKIPEKYKEIFSLHYKEGHSLSEIAKIISKPVNTVKSWHRRALESLHKKIKK